MAYFRIDLGPGPSSRICPDTHPCSGHMLVGTTWHRRPSHTLCPPACRGPSRCPAAQPPPQAQECGQLAADLGPLGAIGEGPCQEHPPAHPEKPSRLCSGLSPVPWPGLSWGSCPRGRGGDTAFQKGGARSCRRLRTGPRASPALPRPFAASFHLPLALRVCGDAATCCCLWAVGRETPGSPQPPRVRQAPAVTRRQHVLRLAGRAE